MMADFKAIKSNYQLVEALTTLITEFNSPECDGNNVVWCKGSPDMDNQHFCATIAEAEREIDDAIILEQEQIIEKLRNALLHSTAALIAAKSTLELINVSTDILPAQIEENERLLKYTES